MGGSRTGVFQKIANEFCANFSDPRYLTDALMDVKKARAVISQQTGRPAASSVMKGRAAIIWNQIRWRMGMRGKFGFQHQSWT